MSWRGAERLRAAISGRNQREIARAINVSPSALNNYVSGRRSPDPDTLARICAALGVSADELLGLTAQKRKPAAAAPMPDQARIDKVVDAKVAEGRLGAVLERIEKRLKALERSQEAVLEAVQPAKRKGA